MKDAKYKKLAEKEFEKFGASNFSGMPTLVLETEDKQVVLTNGYTDFENIKSQLDQLLNNH
jgi:protein-disulfide isomerase-like protein with CxxC motif